MATASGGGGVLLRDAFTLGMCAILMHLALVGFMSTVVRGSSERVQRYEQQEPPQWQPATAQRLERIEHLIERLDDHLKDIDDRLNIIDRRVRKGLARPSVGRDVDASSPTTTEHRHQQSRPSVSASAPSPATTETPAWLRSLLAEMRDPDPTNFFPLSTPAPDSKVLGDKVDGMADGSRRQSPSAASPVLRSPLATTTGPSAPAKGPRSVGDPPPSVTASTSVARGSGESIAAGETTKPAAMVGTRQDPGTASATPAASATPVASATPAASETPAASATPAAERRRRSRASSEDDWEAEWEAEDEAEKSKPARSASSSFLLDELAKLLKKEPTAPTTKAKRRKKGKSRAAHGASATDDDFVIQDVD